MSNGQAAGEIEARAVVQNRGGSLSDFLSPEPLNLVAAGAKHTPLSTAHLPPNPQELMPEQPAGQQDDPLAPGWIPNRRPMYLGLSSVPLPRQPPSDAAASANEGGSLQWQGDATAQAGTMQPRGDAAVPPYPPFLDQPESQSAADAAYRRVEGHSLTGVLHALAQALTPRSTMASTRLRLHSQACSQSNVSPSPGDTRLRLCSGRALGHG